MHCSGFRWSFSWWMLLSAAVLAGGEVLSVTSASHLADFHSPEEQVVKIDHENDHPQSLPSKETIPQHVIRYLEDASSLIDTYLIVELQGYPDLVSVDEIEFLEETLKKAYDCYGSTSYHYFQSVQILPETADSSFPDNSTFPTTLQEDPESFVWLVRVQAVRSLDLDNMEEEDRVFNYTRAHSESAAKMGPSNIDGSTVNEESSLYCELPSSDKVAALWTDLLQHGSSSSSSGHSSILSISSITEMEQEECTGATGNITTSLVLNVESFGDEIDDGILQALEESCVEVYNKLNALNTRNCDPIFRVMESAQVEVIRDGLSPGSSILARRLGNSRTGRFLDDLYDDMNSTLAPSSSSVPTQSPSSSPTIRGPNLLSLVLSINGRCNGCPSDQRFFDEINVRRLEERSESSSHGSQVAATPRFLMELSGDLVEDCFCPVDYEELGGVTSASFFQSLDKKVSDSVGNQGFAFRLLDVQEETCLREDDFISYLTLDMRGDSSEVLGLEKDIEVIVQRTFNLNAEATCDPYGRAITSVQLLNFERRNLRGGRVFEDINRELVDVENSTDTKLPTADSSLAPTMRGPHLFSLIFQVSGVCAGCHREIDLFDEIKLRKRKLSSPSGECTCIDPSLKDGGQTADDFVVAFNKVAANSSIEALGVAIQARGSDSIDSEPPIPPSASPSSSPFSPPSTSIYPSDTPSNVPSVRPSSIPSGGPTFTPSASPTSCLHPTSCQEGKKVCARAANLCGGEGSCNGKNACRDSSGLQVGDSGCIGTSACQSATDLVVGDNSCLETCESLSGSIGSGSCIAPSTCSGTGATVQIGDNSCLETDSCAGLENARRSSLLTIGENR